MVGLEARTLHLWRRFFFCAALAQAYEPPNVLALLDIIACALRHVTAVNMVWIITSDYQARFIS